MSIWFSLQHWDVEPQIVRCWTISDLEESEKVVILSVVTEETWKKLRREMIVKMQIDVPGTGIAFIVPLSSIGGEKIITFPDTEREI